METETGFVNGSKARRKLVYIKSARLHGIDRRKTGKLNESRCMMDGWELNETMRAVLDMMWLIHDAMDEREKEKSETGIGVYGTSVAIDSITIDL